MQVHHDGDHSLACLDLYTCAISFESFVCRRSLNFLLKYSSETTRQSTGQERKPAHSPPNTKIYALLLCTWQKHTKEVICEGVSQGVRRSKCCDLLCRIRTRPSSQCQFRKKKEVDFVRQVSLLSEINQQLKQEFGRIAMKRSRHVHVLQTCFGRPLIGFRCFADKT
jgi:hypothetical protein